MGIAQPSLRDSRTFGVQPSVETLGYSRACYGSAQEALQHLPQTKADVVLIAATLPGAGAGDLVRRLKDRIPELAERDNDGSRGLGMCLTLDFGVCFSGGRGIGSRPSVGCTIHTSGTRLASGARARGSADFSPQECGSAKTALEFCGRVLCRAQIPAG